MFSVEPRKRHMSMEMDFCHFQEICLTNMEKTPAEYSRNVEDKIIPPERRKKY